jgi:hypothetical protein
MGLAPFMTVDAAGPTIHLIVKLLVHAVDSLTLTGPEMSTGSCGLTSVMGLLLDQYAITDSLLESVPLVQHAIRRGTENTGAL